MENLTDNLARLVIENNAVVVLITDAEKRIIFVNQRFTDLTGYTLDDLRGNTPGVLRSADTPPELYRDMWDKLNAGLSWEGQIKNRTKRGDNYWSFQTITPITGRDGRVHCYASFSHDITGFYHRYLEINELATIDQLCGIANRRAFQQQLTGLIEKINRSPAGGDSQLLFLDVDNFKLINDSFGHDAGDRVLQHVTRQIAEAGLPLAVFARLGGDEFGVVMHPALDSGALHSLCARINELVARPISIGERSVSVSVSIGVAAFPGDADDISGLMKCADTAMYAAKRKGRNCHVLYEKEQGLAFRRVIADRGVLLSALKSSAFFPAFQPIVRTADGQLHGYETLARWLHPHLGLITPDRFLPAFKQYGLLTSLTGAMIDKVCERVHRCCIDVPVAINVEACDLMRRDFADDCLQRLARWAHPPQRLILELTESELIENLASCEDNIARLREAGVKLVIDDFGTGYASLSYLRQLPIDGIKIDRSFIQDFPENDEAAEIVATVIGLAKKLQLWVTVEGVEREEQAAQLQLLGPDYLQGYLYGKPMAM